ncbi:MAG: DUF3866 family protein [Candidatus Aquicultorales bacterium]
MISLRKALVRKVVLSRDGRTELSVEIEGREIPAMAYDALVGEVSAGDEVVVNTTAVDLGLGSGGSHFVLWNLKNDALSLDGSGHIMKLRYTPMQIACLAVEESKSPHHGQMSEASSIDGMPVVVGTLHSQLAPIVATVKHLDDRVRIAYVMTDGAALPIALSRSVAELKAKGLIDTTITAGNAFGGDLEAINIYSALAAARVAAHADVAVVAMGPGIVGTDTVLGFSGIEQGQVVNATASLGGRPIAVPRISFKELRKRHLGLSHHTATALGLAALAKSVVPLPRMSPEKHKMVMERVEAAGLDVKHDVRVVDGAATREALDRFGLKVATMGRGLDEELEFFQAAGVSGIVALEMLKESAGVG